MQRPVKAVAAQQILKIISDPEKTGRLLRHQIKNERGVAMKHYRITYAS